MTIAEAVTGTQDTPYYFKWSDFTSGISGTVNETVSIQTLPANGVLSYYNGTAWVDLHSPILVSQQITKTMIDAGQVKFTPAPGESGIDSYNNPGIGNHFSDYAHFLYTTIVNGNQVKNNLMDVDIAPVSPAVTKSVIGTEDSSLTFRWSDFSSNATAAAADYVTVTTLPANGTLSVSHNGSPVAVHIGTQISKADLDAGNVHFMPAANESGEAQYHNPGIGNKLNDYAQFTYSTKVGTTTVTGNTMNVDIAPVVDMHYYSGASMLQEGSPYTPVPNLPTSLTAPTYFNGRYHYDYVTPDGKYATETTPGAIQGKWDNVWVASSLDAASLVDKDGSEKLMYQVFAHNVSGSDTNIMMADQQGNIYTADADGSFWVPANFATAGATVGNFYVFHPQDNSPRTAAIGTMGIDLTLTAWNCEVDSHNNIIAKTYAFTECSNGWGLNYSPLVLDLAGHGIQTTSFSAGTHFDLNADGIKEQTGWVAKDNGLLAIDLNGDGKITSGAELFGDHTRLANGQTAADGYQALAQYDTNHDGQITAADAIFGKLRVWVDANGDGVSQASELKTLAQLGIMSIGLTHDNSHTAQNGNDVALAGSYTLSNGVKHDMADVFFNAVTPVV